MSGELYWKVVIYGCAGSGKTTITDTFHKITTDKNTDEFIPTGPLTKIAKANGATLYFDRGIFQSKIQHNIYFHLFTVAGQENLKPLRKKILKGSDAIILVLDGQKETIDANMKSFLELKSYFLEDLTAKIPLLIMINKHDLPDTYNKDEISNLITDEYLILSEEEISQENFMGIYESCALFQKEMNVYNSIIKVFNHLKKNPELLPKGAINNS